MPFFQRYLQPISLGLLLTLAFIALPTKADDTDEVEQLYQVEVIVFTPNRRPDTSESWRQIHTVQWPSPLIFLKQESDQPQNTTEEVSESTADLNRSQPRTFYAPKPNQFILSDTESYLNRQGYRVLSHQSWLQNISNKKTAPHIVIYGGDYYGEHQTLEGSIQVYVERYLHVDTDLWLIDFSPNVGQASEDIPSLPPRPFNPDSLWGQIPEDDDYSHQPLAWSAGDQQQSDNSSLNIRGLHSDNTINSRSKPIHLQQKTSDLFDSYLSASQWLPNQIIPLRQHRRMRSGELHYIDHPLFGVLVQVNRYNVDSASALSLDEPSEETEQEFEQDLEPEQEPSQ